MSTKLTSRQLEVLTMIKNTIEQTGIPPTRVEIAAALGFRSPNAAEDHIKALTRKGAITVTPGSSRGIKLNHETIAEYFPHVTTPTDHNTSTIDGASHHALSPTLQSPSSLGAASVHASTSHSTLTQVAKSVSRRTSEVTQQITNNIRDLRLSLPVVGRVAAGIPINAIEQHETTLQLDPALFASTPDYLLRVKGESMKDVGILDGDLLAVKKTTSVRNGQIVIARIEDDVTVKRFHRQGDVITLFPENADFKPIIVDNSQHFEIEGIAVGLIRPDTMWH